MGKRNLSEEGIQLLPLREEDQEQFCSDMQEAFQKGGEDFFGPMEKILSRSSIEKSMTRETAVALRAVLDGHMVGGLILDLKMDYDYRYIGNVDFFYVKAGAEAQGIGQAIWKRVEIRYREVKAWELMTPCFESRNIHFYVNKLGFHIIEYLHVPFSEMGRSQDPMDRYFEGMFRLRREIN